MFKLVRRVSIKYGMMPQALKLFKKMSTHVNAKHEKIQHRIVMSVTGDPHVLRTVISAKKIEDIYEYVQCRRTDEKMLELRERLTGYVNEVLTEDLLEVLEADE